MSKGKYRVRNWSNYNKSLVARGNITLWINDTVLKEWHYDGQQRRGGVLKYTDRAIEASLVIKELFKLSYRTCQGFLLGLFASLKISNIEVPCYTTLARRAQTLFAKLSLSGHQKEGLDVLIDSTGVSLYGEGEWKRKKHGEDKQKSWVKLHVAVDAKTKTILSINLSGCREQDCNSFSALVDAIETPIKAIYGDGAYDKRPCYKKAHERKAKLITPPQSNAALQKENKNIPYEEGCELRDEHILFIRQFESLEQGRKEWKIKNNYHLRSLVENTMFRLKSFFGDSMRCRTIDAQRAQLTIRCKIINQFNHIGMPESYLVD